VAELPEKALLNLGFFDFAITLGIMWYRNLSWKRGNIRKGENF
jgi:hypothetical protein